ncbi:uncharacterized protein ATNIH1004_001196 [Aspergillus tanneri]|uniref:MIT domain-containing protein n=1 Tax=Aspergillus tanneri TaxID=1220188 RepID=A0A5M9MYV1_9EURO|nr:uncharacterized protein ATNIH1004_001196 [Aspergillus tanneri]KAA8652292.1 hypothetical protein ATNIH1004_001196 [Aspergillus tanneri]
MASNSTSEVMSAKSSKLPSPRPTSPESVSIACRTASLLPQPDPRSKDEPTRPACVPGQAEEPSLVPPSDSNIQGGLGSLNRWSQSTASSKELPDNFSQGVHPKVLNDDNCGSPGGVHRSNRANSNASPKATGALVNNGHYLNPYSNDLVNPDIPMLELPGIGTSSTFSTSLVDTNTSHLDPTSLESTALTTDVFQNPRSKGGTATSATDQTSEDIFSQSMYDTEIPPNDSQHLTTGSRTGHERRRRGHSQKAMLSKALQKANTAVLLDNAANFEGAMDAYSDACQLLQLVMLRSNGGKDEKVKLREIRDTYMIRVIELQRMDLSFRGPDSKALPIRPLSQESYSGLSQLIEDDNGEISAESRAPYLDRIPPRRQSLLPSVIDSSQFESLPSTLGVEQQVTTISSVEERVSETNVPENLDDCPRYSELPLATTHTSDIYESTSWLDTIDESGASSPVSMGSKASSVYLRHRGSRQLSHGTEAEFDAALDAAVEAAYDGGLEPSEDPGDGCSSDDIVANARRNVELAKQKVREAEREVEVAMTRGRDACQMQELPTFERSDDVDSDYLDEEAEEEERLLEEMTRGYVMDDVEFGDQSKPALPRRSNSNNFSRKIWESPASVNMASLGSALSTLAEDTALSAEDTKVPQSKSPSKNNLNVSPMLTKAALQQLTPGPSVRERRMSHQNTTELKIETHFRTGSDVSGKNEPSALSNFHAFSPKDEPQTSFPILENKPLDSSSSLRPTGNSCKRNVSVDSITEETSTKSGLSRTLENGDSVETAKTSLPARQIGKLLSGPDNLGKSSTGPKTFRSRNVSIHGPDPIFESPSTPSSNAFPTLDHQRGTVPTVMPILPTPSGANFVPNGLPSGGLYLFDNHIHSPTSLGSPNLMAANAPLPLEPCPESFLLRPFWLLRCIYQTISHPRGGYLTTKLFVPRDVWRVKNVKIKAVEEKISNCDLLTAALLKLAKVDTYDADAVLEEMQSFENILDQVQISLSKKIGNEVGVQGAIPLFKSPQGIDDTTSIDTLPPKTSTGPGKSYLSSWRKLRSKNSGFGATTSQPSSKDASKDNLTISSLPMTLIPNSHLTKHSTTQLQFNGPNANYMGALARLCDAAQIKLPSRLKIQV